MFKISSKIEKKILGFYFLNKDSKKYVNELAEIMEVDASNLDKKLKELVSEGLLLSEFEGKQKYYYLNKKYPLVKEVEKFYNLKYGLIKRIKDTLKNIKGIKQAYIFGSYARNSLQQESDIDLLLVGSHSSMDLMGKILKIEKDIQREINTVDFSEDEFVKRVKDNDEFLLEILNNKTIKLL